MGDVISHYGPNYLILYNYFGVCGGDEGIRTLERLPVTPLAGERLRPLGHVSVGRSIVQTTGPQAISGQLDRNFAPIVPFLS